MIRPAPRVLFRVAAGPRIGFGHLIRCRWLARALGVAPRVWLRGSARARAGARRAGVSLVDGSLLRRQRDRPSVIVLDDPSKVHAERVVRRARALGIPVASLHDLGLGRVASDLRIDGSVRGGEARHSPRVPPRSQSTGLTGRMSSATPPTQGRHQSDSRRTTRALLGPRYAVLDPAIAGWRRRRPTIVARRRVLIALGGGRHVRDFGSRLAQAIVDRCPRIAVRIAAGFAGGRVTERGGAGRWIAAPNGLGAELAHATVAVVAGGVTLLEACALGVPAVAVALTHHQATTTRRAGQRGAVVNLGRVDARLDTSRRVADRVARLLTDTTARRRAATAGMRLVDGHGAARVAQAIKRLARVDGGRRDF